MVYCRSYLTNVLVKLIAVNNDPSCACMREATRCTYVQLASHDIPMQYEFNMRSINLRTCVDSGIFFNARIADIVSRVKMRLLVQITSHGITCIDAYMDTSSIEDI